MIKSIVQNTWSIFLGLAFLMLGNGLQGTLTGVRATFEGFNPTVTGVIMTGYSIGFLVGSLLTPRLVAGVGHIRVFAALASMASTSILVQILFIHPTVWFLARLLTGICFAGAFVIVESWLNARSDDRSRGKVLSLYMIVMFVGMAAGQWLMLLADPAAVDLFLLASILLSLALVPVLIGRIRAPEIELHLKMGFRELVAHAPSGALTVLLIGIANGTLYGMGAVYAISAGFSVFETSLFMSSFILFGAALQWPVGWLSDRIDRRLCIALTALLITLLCLVLMLFDLSLRPLIALFGLLGGLSLIIYSLGVSAANDRLQPEQMVSAGALIALMWGGGAILGPPTVGFLLDRLGPEGFYLHLALTHLTIAVIVGYFYWRHPAVVEAEQTPFQAVAPRITVVALETVGQEAEEAQLADAPGASAKG